MSFHLVAYYYDDAGTSSYVGLEAVSDGVVSIANNHIVLDRDMSMFAAYAVSADLLRARISMPRLETRAYIHPVQTGGAGVDDPNVADWLANPLTVRGSQEVAVQAYRSGAGTQDIWAFLWLAQSLSEIPIQAETLTIRGEAEDPSGANAWADVANVVWDQPLPAGRWAVIGAQHSSDSALAHRWIFDGAPFRPGGLSNLLETERSHQMFYGGGLGIWGEFDARSMPRPQVFTTAAATNHVFYLELVRLG